MIQYLLKRIFLFIPTLLIISIICFFLSQNSQQELINDQLEQIDKQIASESIQSRWENFAQKRAELGMNIPIFYFSIHRYSSTDTLFRIVDPAIKKSLQELSYWSADWTLCNQYFQSIKEALYATDFSSHDKQRLLEIARNTDPHKINEELTAWNDPRLRTIHEDFGKIYQGKSGLYNLLPVIHWQGFNNQYHRWLSGLLKGDLGRSKSDGRSVSSKLGGAIYWTSLLSIISIILSFGIGIFTGVYGAYWEGSKTDKFFNLLFYGFYSLPNFWLATLLILFFASGDFLQWFPPYGLGQLEENMNAVEVIQLRMSHLILPIICLTYGSIAYIHRQVRSAILQQLKSDYVVTAKAKGLSFWQIIRNQVFKNASFPLITISGSLLAAIISGSFIVEFIFSIPGMGKLTVDSILSRDYPTVFGILMLSAILSIVGILIADILYYLNDPRLSYNANSKTSV